MDTCLNFYRICCLSTIFAGLSLVVSTYFWYSSGIYSAFGFFTILISIFLIFTHRSNISRMIEGKEKSVSESNDF